MNYRNNLKIASRNLFASKQRTILAVIGITIGIASVIAMISIGSIVSNESLKKFKEMGTDILTLRKDYSQNKASRGKEKALTLNDVLNIPNVCPSIQSVAPYIDDISPVMYKGKVINMDTTLGVTRSFFELNNLKIQNGRFISDIERFSYFCVIGSDIAQNLIKAGATQVIGQQIKIAGIIFTVAGVIEKSTASTIMRQFDANSSIFIPITSMQKIKGDIEISRVIAKIKSDTSPQIAQKQVQDYFKTIKAQPMKVVTAEELIEGMQKQMLLFTILLGAIGSISLIVGGIGIMNVMLVSVSNQKKEIGVFRALGARRKDIQSQFLTESIILSFLGGIAGIVIGVLISFIISYVYKWDFFISYTAIFIGFFVSSAVGIFFGFYPARQASMLDPISVLRSE